MIFLELIVTCDAAGCARSTKAKGHASSRMGLVGAPVEFRDVRFPTSVDGDPSKWVFHYLPQVALCPDHAGQPEQQPQ